MSASVDALTHAVDDNYYGKLPVAFSDPQVLVALAHAKSISATERSLSESSAWLVMVHFPLRSAAEALRQRQPSYFVKWPEASRCDPQVHILDTPIYAKRFCQLLVFRAGTTRPTDLEIRQAIQTLRVVLGLGENAAVIATEPVHKGKEAWFRADGDMHVLVRDRVLALGLRAALAKKRASDGEGDHHASGDITKLCDPNRPPMYFVFWTRQSNEDSRRARDSVPRQVASLMSAPVLETIQPNDRIIVIAEICSSSRHPLTDRRIYHSIPHDRPIQLLTVNPDRLTRRSDEVETILADLSSNAGAWHTSGLVLGEEGSDVRDWHTISPAVSEDIEAKLKIGSSFISTLLH